MPRFARDLPDNGKELLSMNEVLTYLLNSYKPLINKSDLQFIHAMQDEVRFCYIFSCIISTLLPPPLYKIILVKYIR